MGRRGRRSCRVGCLEREEKCGSIGPRDVRGVGPPFLQLDQVLHRETMETVIQVRNTDEEGRGRGDVEAGEIDELKHALLANDGQREVERQVIFSNKSSNVGHYDCEKAEGPLVGGIDAVLVWQRKRDAVLHDVG